MRLKQNAVIEDPRKHSPQTIEALRRLIAGDVAVRPDPKRPDFYELDDATQTFYIHISPASGRILLLATWPICAEAEHGLKSVERAARHLCGSA